MRPRSSPRGISWWMMPLPGRHPLHVSAPDGSLVPQRVAVVHLALEHVGDGLDAPMGMPGKSRSVERGVVGAEVVEHQKGVEKSLLAGTEGAGGDAPRRLRWSAGSSGRAGCSVRRSWPPRYPLSVRHEARAHVTPRDSGSAPSGSSASRAPAAPPGDASGGAPGGGSAVYPTSAVYTQSGGSQSEDGKTYSASEQDQSAILVTDGGVFKARDAVIETTGDSSSNDSSSFYGLNAAVVATSGSSIALSDSSISTTGSGATAPSRPGKAPR